jgi:hypothetical protein
MRGFPDSLTTATDCFPARQTVYCCTERFLRRQIEILLPRLGLGRSFAASHGILLES